MDTPRLWTLVKDARGGQVPEPGAEAVATRASVLLASWPREDIVAVQQVLWDLMAFAYRSPLWAAAYVINGGCSDDGFAYFRGWLIAQGRDTFERVVADPDVLADLPAVRTAAADGAVLECEEMLHIAFTAYLAATGGQFPVETFTVWHPVLDPDWNFDFDDGAEMARRLPRLAVLYPG